MERAGRGMRRLALLGWLILLPALVVAGVRFAPSQSWTPGAQMVGLFPLVAPTALLALVLLLLGRRWWSASTAALLAVTCGVVLAPRLIDSSVLPTANQAGAEQIRVGSVNSYFSRADPDALTTELRELDVACISEATPELEVALEKAGLMEDLTSVVSAAEPGAKGTLLLSRLPVRTLPEIEGTVFRMPRAAVRTADGEVIVTCAHPVPPVRIDIALWESELRTIRDAAAMAAGPQIVMGDFNATWDHRLLREIAEHSGLQHVAITSGHGVTPTWPVIDGPLPAPFVAIDHVLTDLPVHGAQTIELPGTDHRMVTAHLGVPDRGVG